MWVWLDDNMFISRLIFIQSGNEANHPISNAAKNVVIE
jgi:hypothetical protein